MVGVGGLRMAGSPASDELGEHDYVILCSTLGSMLAMPALHTTHQIRVVMPGDSEPDWQHWRHLRQSSQ